MKVILTKEQGDSLNRALESNEGDSNKVLLLFIGGLLCGAKNCLKELSVPDMARALYIGYEIEQPKFGVGDIVVGLITGNVYRLTEKNGKNFYGTRVKDGEIRMLIDRTCIRHATKEEAFWAELGREVGELKDNDVIFTKFNNAYRITNDGEDSPNSWVQLHQAKEWYENSTIIAIYPSESFQKFPVGES